MLLTSSPGMARNTEQIKVPCQADKKAVKRHKKPLAMVESIGTGGNTGVNR